MGRRRGTSRRQSRDKLWLGIVDTMDWGSDADALVRSVAPMRMPDISTTSEEVIEAKSTLLRCRGHMFIDEGTATTSVYGMAWLVRQPQSGAIGAPPTVDDDFLSQQDILGQGWVYNSVGAGFGSIDVWHVDIKAKRIMEPDDQLTVVTQAFATGGSAALKMYLRFLFALP